MVILWGLNVVETAIVSRVPFDQGTNPIHGALLSHIHHLPEAPHFHTEG